MWGERTSKLPPGETIESWPLCLNNVCWSKDNIIAVGGPDIVTLLIPKYKRSHADDLIWDKIKLRTSNFTDDEVPLQLPLSWRSSSIGEEQSEISVTALDWSPPGLAKHKRCVLAVLTSNHVLSLWECTGRLEDAADWERVVVVNHALQAYNIANDQSIAQEPQHDKSERLKIKQRIRSFAWSHAPPSEFTADISGACHTLGHPYLAVSTESGQVHVLRVLSPYDILTPDVTEWTLSVVGCFQSQINPAKKNPLEACMPLTHVSAKEFVSQLAWSPWSKDANGTLSSVLAFVAQEALHCKIIRAHVDTNDIVLELGTTVAHLVDDQIARSAGAMRWLPKPTSADELYLVYPCRKMIYCLVFHLRKASGIRPTKRELGNAWDELSGIAFGSHRSARPYMQLTYHMNSITAPATGFSLPLTGESPLPTAPWQKALGRAKTKFGTDYNLQDNVMTKTYGIAASPLGDLFAVNSTFHPSDGVEYVIHSDQVSTLVLTPARDGIDCDHLPEHGGPSLPYELSAEAVLFSLQHSFKPLHDAEFGTALLTPQILRALSLTDLPVTEQNHASLTEDTPIPSIVRQLRESLFFDRDSIASSTEQLATFVTLERSRKVPPPNATIVRRIATEVVQLPHFVAEASPLSQTISHIHSLILAKLDAREGRDNGGLLADINDVDVERCDACGSAIPFESLRWARCVQDHHYTRCALTFIAIQPPASPKSCGICNLQYLNEHALPGFKQRPSQEDIDMPDSPSSQNGNQPVVAKQGTPVTEPLDSLARILLAACDRCAGCGGKFTG